MDTKVLQPKEEILEKSFLHCHGPEIASEKLEMQKATFFVWEWAVYHGATT